ncbi:MAG TPA: LssY C-terminal domain-containing protein [Candidatus Binatia bacterium]
MTVAVPSDEESARLFGVPLASNGIQPVWLDIDNGTDLPYWFMPSNLDPGYFTPLEAANRARYRLRPGANESMRTHFLAGVIEPFIGARQHSAGWLFTNLDQGVKPINVDLIGARRLVEFFFFVRIPGLRTDYREEDHEQIYGTDQIQDVDESALREALERMPCCATTKNGSGLEDPLNFVLIGTQDEILPSFARTGWHMAEVLRPGAALRAFWSYFFGHQYRYAPIGAVYAFDRRQDLSLQKTRETARERNHLRLWQTRLRFEGKPVWIGQISRDIGLSFGLKGIVTHEVDPDVDEARAYLLQDMLRSQRLAGFGWVKGVGSTPSSAPRHMADGTPFFTDGLRAVMTFGDEPTSLEEIRLFEWEGMPAR